MKQTKLTFVLGLLCLVFGSATAQIVGPDAFLIAPGQEVGIHFNGFEGSSMLPSFPTNYRGTSGRLAFLSNPQNDDWMNYDGDFMMPGAPESRFGITIDGTTYYNSAATISMIPSSGLSNYQEYNKCKFVDWEGSVAGVDILMTYKLDTTDHYYTVNVVLTNTTATDMNDVYFYKSLDPDNNQEMGWGFATYNEIEYQPTAECSKALVSATSTGGWESYIGLGSLDTNTRVARGGFYIESGADVWNSTGGLIGTIGSAAYADESISISHRDAVLPAGGSSEFQFVVVMDEYDVEEALLKLNSLEYEDSPGFSGFCEDTTITVEVGGVSFDITSLDTIKTCTYEPFEIAVEGPIISEYNWEWIDSNDVVLDSLPETIIFPGTEADTNFVCCVGTPSACSEGGPAIGFCFVLITLQAPEIVVDDFEVLCGDSLEIASLVITDTAEVEGTVMQFYAEYPDEAGDLDGIWPSAYMQPGDSVYVMVSDTANGCYDVELITYASEGGEASVETMTMDVCNTDGGIDLNSVLTDADPDGSWSSSLGSPAFDSASGMFDPTTLSAGTYNFYYTSGEEPCPLDSTIITITVFEGLTAGDDVVIEMCTNGGEYLDLNLELSGADTGGYWEEVVSKTLLNETTGVLFIGGLDEGTYEYLYIVPGSGPCGGDTALITVTVSPEPIAGFTFSPETIETDDPDVYFTNTSINAVSYYWNFGDGSTSTDENPSHTYPAIEEIYEVWLIATNSMGCVDSVSTLVAVDESLGGCFYMPNSFTPDGDNLNTEFKPILCEGIDIYDYHLTIFNRWGDIVFESYHFDHGWKGNYGDQGMVDGGIYIWQAEFGEIGSDRKYQLRGHLTLLK